MKISVAQTRPFKGDIQRNIDCHLKLTEQAVALGAELIIFPELSLTGYEPTLAKALATNIRDQRLGVFQEASDSGGITIGVGLPVNTAEGICIGMVILQPQKPRELYAKKYIHADEVPFFICGQSTINALGPKNNIALAICYELAVPEHTKQAVESGADLYMASVAKSISGIDKALDRLSHIARTYSIPVLMSNCIGQADAEECAGKTSVWNNKGAVIGQLDGTNEGILIFDTDTEEVVEKTIIRIPG